MQIHIPTPLRAFTGQQATVEAQGRDVGEALEDLVRTHPPLRAQLFNADGQLRSFVNVYLNDEDIRYTGSGKTPVNASDTISIVPSIAGGCAGASLGSAGRC
ncbi:MAG TPA: MoaD/ThiS family protein [Terriglobales bacterium]|nr:MoaD/ThiS family protein [Terriglobales bacterium]